MVFDYAIIGLGAAGMQLALQMVEDPFFDSKKILLLDKSRDAMPKKTWCFWEEKGGKWDYLVAHKWEETLFIGPTDKLEIPLRNQYYKMIKSEAFFQYGFETLSKKSNIKILFEEVLEIREKKEEVSILCKRQNFSAKEIFDSRISPNFFQSKKHITINQHFKGWFVEFDYPIFEEHSFTMMDFSAAHKNSTSFMYVLPTSKNSALLEYTFFTREVCEEKLYDELIENYIKTTYPEGKNFKIIETEMGVIPMSSYPFHKEHTKRITKIGTAGGWVRPSTGYSFKNSERNTKKIIENIKNGLVITTGIHQPKYLFYDTLLLDILQKHNHKGPSIFESIFQKNDIETVFRFLGGTSTIQDDLKVIASQKPMPFIKAFFRYCFYR